MNLTAIFSIKICDSDILNAYAYLLLLQLEQAISVLLNDQALSFLSLFTLGYNVRKPSFSFKFSLSNLNVPYYIFSFITSVVFFNSVFPNLFVSNSVKKEYLSNQKQPTTKLHSNSMLRQKR